MEKVIKEWITNNLDNIIMAAKIVIYLLVASAVCYGINKLVELIRGYY